ncbi:hypothetical protein GCM10010315_12410 [Streptomyces luteosporeus]|uniref:Tn3 transposase DDE domain-containing protein n=1 Tax=Streptomyces luteosporeus TaxID=173856 RepID=A0ABP6G2X9_9ACTN
MPDQNFSGLGKAHGTARTGEQRRLHGILQRLYLLTDRGLAAAQRTGGRGEGAGLCDGSQNTEMAGLDHAPNVRS